MNILRWLPVVMVLPTFAFIFYWMWRHIKASGRLPRAREELQQVDPQFKDEFTRASNRLRWFNLWLFLAVLTGTIIFSVFNR